jgi:Rgg/GadR/MutR family transcriptional activator
LKKLTKGDDMTIYKKYGDTLRKLRKQRGLKLTSFEHVGVSSAALCKFERGLSFLKFDKLLMVLSELSITLSEYEKCLNDYTLDRHEELIQKNIVAVISNNIEEFYVLYKEALQIKEQYLALAIKGLYAQLSVTEREILGEYFEQIFYWRYTDLYTFYLSLDWLDVSQILFLVEDFFVSRTEVFCSLEHRIRTTHIVCRASMILISKGYKDRACYLLSYLRQKSYKHTMFTKNVMNFVHGFWETKFGDKEKGMLAIKAALKNFDLLSFLGVSDYYIRLYEKYSNEVFEKEGKAEDDNFLLRSK